ncbi:MAG: hypothetical protein ACR2QT_03525 [Woeseiaceae bacterium]
MIRLKKSDVAMALIAVGCGGYMLLMTSGVIPAEMAPDTPRWIGGLAGFAFIIAGAMIFLRDHSRALDLLAAILLAAFALMGAWVSVYGAEGISGGLPLAARETNMSIGRVVFGLGAVLCFAGCLWALHRFFRSHN